jgi:hypothetical protein
MATAPLVRDLHCSCIEPLGIVGNGGQPRAAKLLKLQKTPVFMRVRSALEHAARLVPTDSHRDFLGDARARQKLDGASSQIVERFPDVRQLYLRLGAPTIRAGLVVQHLAGGRVDGWFHLAEPELQTARLPHFPQSFNSNSMAAPVQTVTHVRARFLSHGVTLAQQDPELRHDRDDPALEEPTLLCNQVSASTVPASV